MSKFNQKVSTTKEVINSQGGMGIKLDPKLELIGLLSTGLSNRFHETESDGEIRLGKLISEIAVKDVEFVAKALVYARTVVGQRSVTHAGSVKLAEFLSGNPLGSKFYGKRNRKGNNGGIIYRLDDMLEIASYYFMKNPNNALPNAIKKGFKSAIEDADVYELAKYQGKGKAVSLVDLVNLVHPKPAKNKAEAFNQLMNGVLKQFNTAEDKQTKSGSQVAAAVKSGEITKDESVKVLAKAKSENWKELILSNKLGYLALLRNLRNITMQSDDVTFKMALEILTNEKMIRQSLVFPHQIDIAMEVFKFFKDCDMAGFNIMRFDLPLLVEEMLRAGAPQFPHVGTRFVDSMSIFHHYEKRDLTAALKFYCNKDLTDAHSAEADTLATVDILEAQIERYDLDSSIDNLQELSTQGKEIIDYAGKFTRNEAGDIIFTFGKNKGKKV